MAFLDKTGLQNLTNKLVQGDAIKVASPKGTTVKEVINNIQRECESVALPNNMILENRVNQFVVGQSRDMDVSRDVEEGLSQIQLQGQTYQNLITFKSKTYNDDYPRVYFKRNIDLKPNTTYTFITPNFDSNKNAMYIGFNGSKQLLGYQKKHIGTFTTSADMKNVESGIYFFYNGKNKQDFVRTCPTTHMLLEGDYSQIPINEIPQYFEGIKSSFEDKVVNINVQGKNLFDKSKTENILYNYFINNDGNIQGAKDTLTIRQKVKPNTKYSLNGNYNRSTVRFENKNKEYISHTSNKVITTPSNCEYIAWYVGNEAIKDKSVDNLQIEEAAVGTSFEPYYNYNYKFDIKEPLRRLPNGVCDEIRNNNGKWELVRRIGKTVLDETYDYALWGNTPSDGYFTCHANNYLQGKDITFSANKKNVICDTFAVSTGTGAFRNMSFYFTNPHITVLSSEANSISKFKEWIAKNPITLYYELVIPIITPIDPIEFNISQGTTISINSDIAPISTHEVILNRSGQIEQGIELIADLRSRIDKLEKVYDSNLIATQYRLNNLKLNYELEREED